MGQLIKRGNKYLETKQNKNKAFSLTGLPSFFPICVMGNITFTVCGRVAVLTSIHCTGGGWLKIATCDLGLICFLV